MVVSVSMNFLLDSLRDDFDFSLLRFLRRFKKLPVKFLARENPKLYRLERKNFYG